MALETVTPQLQRKIAEATAILVEAEKELDTAMREIVSAERADKTIITEAVQSAFHKLATARSELEELLRAD